MHAQKIKVFNRCNQTEGKKIYAIKGRFQKKKNISSSLCNKKEKDSAGFDFLHYHKTSHSSIVTKY